MTIKTLFFLFYGSQISANYIWVCIIRVLLQFIVDIYKLRNLCRYAGIYCCLAKEKGHNALTNLEQLHAVSLESLQVLDNLQKTRKMAVHARISCNMRVRAKDTITQQGHVAAINIGSVPSIIQHLPNSDTFFFLFREP